MAVFPDFQQFHNLHLSQFHRFATVLPNRDRGVKIGLTAENLLASFWVTAVPKQNPLSHHPIFSAVAASLIVALILYFAPGAWAWLKEAILFSWNLFIAILTYRLTLPFWLWLPLMILAAAAVVGILSSLKRDAEPTWRDYTADVFEGMKWEWNYDSYQGRACNLTARCPIDNTILVHWDDYYRCEFQCETCNIKRGPFGYVYDEYLGRIRRKIDQKITTGEWKQVVATYARSEES